MNTDTAIVMLLADLQRQIESLKTENDTLRGHVAAIESQVTPMETVTSV